MEKRKSGSEDRAMGRLSNYERQTQAAEKQYKKWEEGTSPAMMQRIRAEVTEAKRKTKHLRCGPPNKK